MSSGGYIDRALPQAVGCHQVTLTFLYLVKYRYFLGMCASYSSQVSLLSTGYPQTATACTYPLHMIAQSPSVIQSSPASFSPKESFVHLVSFNLIIDSHEVHLSKRPKILTKTLNSAW